MAQWYQFYHHDDDAEIKVGLYDRWLCRIEYGPTQAERALVHTEMMNLAHERRLVVAERDLDMSGFEREHSHRIGSAIDLLETHFNDRSLDSFYEPADVDIELDCVSHEPEKVRHVRNELLLGFDTLSVPDSHNKRYEYTPSLPQTLQRLSVLSTSKQRPMEVTGDVTEVDETSPGVFPSDAVRAALAIVSRKRRRDSGSHPRQLKEPRLRETLKRFKPNEVDHRPFSVPLV